MADDTLLAVYERLAADRPDDPGLTFVAGAGPGAGAGSGTASTRTWAQVLGRADELAHWLGTHDVVTGSRVVVEMATAPDLVPLVLAVWQRGAVAVLADPLWGAWLRDAVVAHSGAELAVALPSDDGATAEPLSPRADRPPLPPDCALLSYTSGTTGDPKGVVLRHRHLLSAYRNAGTAVRGHLGAPPTAMGCSMRVSGLGVLGMHYLWPATMGAATVTFPELALADAGTFWDRQVAHGVDLTYLVPALVALLNYAGRPPAEPGAGSRPLPLVLCAGAPLAPDVQERFQATFGATLLNAYGLTEVSFAAFFGDLGERGRGGPATGSLGRPSPSRPGCARATARSWPPASPVRASSSSPDRPWPTATTTTRPAPPPRSGTTAGCAPATWPRSTPGAATPSSGASRTP